MRRLMILLVCCLLLPASAHKASAGSVSYTKHWIRQAVAHVVTVDLNDPNVTVSPAVALKGVGHSEGFGSMLSRLHPAAAITGTFFCVRSLIPVGDIVIDGKQVNSGCVGTAVCFTADNRVVFRDFGPSAKTYPDSHPAIVCSGPKLVVDGNVYLDPRTEGFHDGALFRQASRAAIGVTKWNKLLMVTVSRPVYLRKLAWIMKELGAVNAVNLDGGSSTALYCKGRVFNHPARRLTNLILVYDSPDVYAKVKPMFAPLSVVATSSQSQGGG
jgi:exopolysaccharide biosynthesis protein